MTLELPGGLVEKQGWHDSQEYKIRIISKILDELIALREDGLGPMRRLIQAVLDIPNFDHLRILENGSVRVSEARKSVESLREIVMKHDDSFWKKSIEQKQISSRAADAVKRRNEEINRLQGIFFNLVAVQDHKKRGFLFEKFLKEFLDIYDLDPRGSFRLYGEQIDGAFEFEGTQFLLEAKWEKKRQGVTPLDSFSKKVERKLENTLGLFISLEGFTDEGLQTFRCSRPTVILMDGEDLALILQGIVDFRHLLKRKIRYAAQTGNPYLKARDIMAA